MPAGVGGTSKMVYTALMDYQKARAQFVEAVGGLLEKNDPMVLQSFLEADLVKLLQKPLVQDVIPSVQIASLNIVSTLATQTDVADGAFTEAKELDKVKTALTHPMKLVQQAACNTFTAVACKNGDNADAVLAVDVLPELRQQMAEVDPGPKEATVRLLNTLVLSGPEVADNIMTLDTMQDMVNNLALPEAPDGLKAAICGNLADTATYNERLAARVVESGALPLVTAQLNSKRASTKVRAACLLCLGQVAKHTDALAEAVVETGMAPSALAALSDGTASVRCNAALLIRECTRKTRALCEATLADGGVACLGRHLTLEAGDSRALPTVLTLGHLADFSIALALQAVKTAAAQAALPYLAPGLDEKVQVAAAWALARLARHGKETAQPLAVAGALPALVTLYADARTEVLRTKTKEALKEIVHNCHEMPALEGLVSTTTPPEILRHVLYEFETGLPESVQDKRNFVTSGALMRMLKLSRDLARDHLTLELRSAQSVQTISTYFPPDVVAYYS